MTSHTSSASTIIYTKTDEAPALATYSFFPIVQAFTQAAGVHVESRDISLAARILANFPENLKEHQKQADTLAELGALTQLPDTNIIKLPNISASVPQLQAAIKELQAHGFDIPNYPEDAQTDEDKAVKSRYAKVLGSAVNPVLREGNSDRRVADAVKQYAKDNPHAMGEWSKDSKTHVAHMSDGDFYSSEQSVVLPKADSVSIQLDTSDGENVVLKYKLDVQQGEVIDASVMRCKALRAFYAEQIADANKCGILLSLHLKATMMKISDPIIFGHAVTVYFKDVFEKYADVFADLGVDANNGLGDVYAKIASLPEVQRQAIEADIQAVYQYNPALAMVDSDKGITNLHVPSDVIIDASMPAAIRSSGMMWGIDGQLQDT
ncbi:MAG: NADP-dependent isocitrate dehydrogenase, partial [Mariprofundaceae bacterium]|nr:NADP-dependent isocitrate dehydrogenase [Mariprofundaceae bacterium]